MSYTHVRRIDFCIHKFTSYSTYCVMHVTVILRRIMKPLIELAHVNGVDALFITVSLRRSRTLQTCGRFFLAILQLQVFQSLTYSELTLLAFDLEVSVRRTHVSCEAHCSHETQIKGYNASTAADERMHMH